MQLAAGPMANEQQIPRLSPHWDPAHAALSPAEGFLLSRIDGRTPWAQLRQIGGMPPEEVDRCLERWLSEGILTVNGSAGLATGAPPDSFEDGIDLSHDGQLRILEFESTLDRPYHALLGVDRGADVKTIKRAYFALSKEFHPDRHFHRELGSFAVRLDRIFKKLVEAYELLSDPATRAEVERSMSQAPPPADEASAEAAAAGAPTDQAGPPLTGKRATLEGLRRHFRIPEKILTERRFKAKQFFQAAMVSSKKGRWIEAGASVRLAIAFDPWNDEYKGGFATVQARVHQVRASELLSEAEASLDASAQQEAMRMYEEALGYQPCDPEINEKAAALALELGNLDSACEYAENACELSPERAACHRILGQALGRSGLLDKAKAALGRALELDPDDAEAKSEIDALKRSRKKKR